MFSITHIPTGKIVMHGSQDDCICAMRDFLRGFKGEDTGLRIRKASELTGFGDTSPGYAPRKDACLEASTKQAMGDGQVQASESAQQIGSSPVTSPARLSAAEVLVKPPSKAWDKFKAFNAGREARALDEADEI